MKNTNKMAISLAAAFLLVVIVIAASIWAYAQIDSSNELRTRTYTVLKLADELLTALVDAETSQRGYILAGDLAYLEPYLVVRDKVEGLVGDLLTQTRNQEARQHLTIMGPLASAKMNAVAAIVDFFRAHGSTKGLILPPGPSPKALMDSFRAEKASYTRIEEVALERNQAAFQENMGFLLVGVVALCVMMLGCALMAAYFLHRENQQRIRDFALRETAHLLDQEETANRALLQTNLSLQASEAKLAVTLRSIGDAVLTTDATGLVTLLNPLAETLTGWTNQEALGQPVDLVFRIISQATREPATVPVLETLTTGALTGLANHILMISRTGGERAIADSCSPIIDGEGLVIGAVLVFRDVTDSYATQQVILDGAIFLQSILNTVADGVITFHADDGTIETVNPAGLKMLGYTETQLLGMNVSHLVHELLPGRMAGNPWDGGAAWELTGWRRDGTRFPLDLIVTEMWTAGRKHFTCLFRDITVRRENEQALAKTHDELRTLTVELERAARAKSDFLANMSHELRTPLNSIIGFSEVLFDLTFGTLNEKQTKYVANVLNSGAHLLLLINQILDMSKVESGKMTLNLTSLPLNATIHEIVDLVEDSVRKKKLEMELQIAPDLPDIQADLLKVKEILYNLLSNVVKFTPSGGRVGLKARPVGSMVEVEVWDTGIGIAPENLSRVFEGFFRVESPLFQVSEGTGLGLPLSKKLVELHGGTLVVESEGLNKGTVIRFTLPVEAQ